MENVCRAKTTRENLVFIIIIIIIIIIIVIINTVRRRFVSFTFKIESLNFVAYTHSPTLSHLIVFVLTL